MVSAGRILILPQGTWDNATMYNMLDLVAYNGISWLCKRQCVGITPSVTATEYWQQFGSSAPIASTTVAGLVMPDGQTITINTTTGAIAVPTATAAALGLVKVDGTSITIDANGVISSAGGNLSNLGDVAITSLQTGQVLIWNQTNQKWQNGTIAGALSQLSDVLINSASEGQILVYDSTAGKWKNATAESTLSSSTKPIQTKVVKDMASDVIETLSAGASQAYSAGDLLMCSNGKWYKAITDISQNQTLTAGGNVEETSQRALNTNLTHLVQQAQHGIFELWKNSNMTSNFSGQDVVLTNFDSNKYDAIIIVGAVIVGEPFGAKWFEFDKEVLDISQYTGTLHDIFFSGTSIYYAKRDVTFSLSGSSLTITFGNGITGGTSGTPGTDNSRMVPVRVLGLVHNDQACTF